MRRRRRHEQRRAAEQDVDVVERAREVVAHRLGEHLRRALVNLERALQVGVAVRRVGKGARVRVERAAAAVRAADDPPCPVILCDRGNQDSSTIQTIQINTQNLAGS